MDLPDERIIEILKPILMERTAFVYLDTRMKEKGERLAMGNREYAAPFEGYFIFADLMPGANWGHPAKGIFVSPEGDEVHSIDMEFPPFFGEPPESYRKISI